MKFTLRTLLLTTAMLAFVLSFFTCDSNGVRERSRQVKVLQQCRELGYALDESISKDRGMGTVLQRAISLWPKTRHYFNFVDRLNSTLLPGDIIFLSEAPMPTVDDVSFILIYSLSGEKFHLMVYYPRFNAIEYRVYENDFRKWIQSKDFEHQTAFLQLTKIAEKFEKLEEMTRNGEKPR